MQLKKMELETLSCERQDLELQRCRLSAALMEKLHLSLGKTVRIHRGSDMFICRAWPRSDSAEGFIELSHLVTVGRPLSENVLVKDTPDISINPLSSITLKSVSVSVVLQNIADVTKHRKELSNSSWCLYKYVRRILRNIQLASNAVVNCNSLKLGSLYGISHIIVTDFSEEGEVCGCVTADTAMTIKEVMSQDRYSHNQNEAQQITSRLGGLDAAIRSLEEIVSFPMRHSQAAREAGIQWHRGVLLRGPPGCGKTSLVRHIASKVGAYLLTTGSIDVFGSRPGESESKLRDIFVKAQRMSEEGPCILFLDEIESLCSKDSSGKGGSEKRVTSQLLTLMDELQHNRGHLMVVGATNRPHVLDPAIRRPGRFDKEIFLGIPGEGARREILEALTSDLELTPDIDLASLAEATPGYVGADLASLVQQAFYTAVSTSHKQTRVEVEMKHFTEVLHSMVPSSQRGSDILVDFKPVYWEDIGGLDEVKQQIKQAIEWPLKHSDAFRRLGLRPPAGVLLYGPPGCAKTTLVRAAATACHINFLAVSGAQLYSAFVGDSERKLNEVFAQARAGAPSILFLDELDSIVGKRSDGSKAGGVSERVLSTLLNQMDGIGQRLDDNTSTVPQQMVAEGTHTETTKDDVGGVRVDNSRVIVVAATNRPDMLDEALMRPGRLDRLILVPPPDLKARQQILSIHSKKMKMNNVSMETIASATEHFTGADLENLCREAALHALSVDGIDVECVTQEHFMHVLRKMTASLSQEQLDSYASLICHAKH